MTAPSAPPNRPKLTDLLRGASLRGDAETLDVDVSTRLGRALGTLARRRTPAPAGAAGVRLRVVVARSDNEAAVPVRDGLVRGLLLAGHEVKDIGAVASDVFTFALRHFGAAAGVVVAVDGGGEGAAMSLVFFLGGRPLVAEGLQALVQIAERGEYSAGEGSLDIVDVRPAFRTASGQGPEDDEADEDAPEAP